MSVIKYCEGCRCDDAGLKVNVIFWKGGLGR